VASFLIGGLTFGQNGLLIALVVCVAFFVGLYVIALRRSLDRTKTQRREATEPSPEAADDQHPAAEAVVATEASSAAEAAPSELRQRLRSNRL
jgi:predicted lipid-binding transport protein (Tim44 family)